MVPGRTLRGRGSGILPPIPWYDEIIGEVTAAFNARDFSQSSSWAHEDVVFDWSRSIADNRGVHEGIEAAQNVFESFLEAWESVDWKVTQVEELNDDRLLLTTSIHARGRDSGIEVPARGAQIWQFRDGKIARVTMFQSREDALSAVAEDGAD
jgi:ketosteroid isomerase-like protein